MHIDYYREFLELARCLNFTEAANNLHITQPALSKHVTALEKEYNAELFIRTRRNVQLSEAGRILYGAATTIVDSYDRAMQDIAAITEEDPIRVDGILYDSTISSIISMSTILLDDSHKTPVIFSHEEDAPLFDLLEEGKIDVVFAYENEAEMNEKGFVCKPLSRSQFVAVVDTKHPLARKKSLRIEDLKDETFIQFVDEYSISGWKRIEAVCSAHGFEPKTRPILGRSITSYVTTPPGDDVLILQQNMRQIKTFSETGNVACIPIEDKDAAFVIYYMYKKENEERLKHLIEALEESKNIIFTHRKERS